MIILGLLIYFMVGIYSACDFYRGLGLPSTRKEWQHAIGVFLVITFFWPIVFGFAWLITREKM